MPRSGGRSDDSNGPPEERILTVPAQPLPTSNPPGNPQLAKVLSQARNLAVMPQVVFQIMELTGSDASSAAALEKVIQVDPGFSARILAQANSAHFALPRRVTSIRDALLFVGFRSVRELAMTVGVYDMFLGRNDRGSLRRRTWWRHSLDSAVCAKALAQHLGCCPPEEAYTGALLHLIGKTLLDRSEAGGYGKVDLLTAKGYPDCLAERAVFGVDHEEVSSAACRDWGFPEQLLQGVEYLHRPDPEHEAAPHRCLTAISNRIASLVMEQSRADDESGMWPDWCLEALGLSQDDRAGLTDRGLQAVSQANHLLR
ncbi:MAG: HDOD domain-containing protein, partial [Fimbriimonadaceae bacterium]|nr:HDOD domain-containing protein [Fimbriimonadaceae bacterium]